MTNDQIAAIKRDYDRDGFVILRGYLCEQALEDLQERATRLAADLHDRYRERKDLNRDRSRDKKGGRSGRTKANVGSGNVFKNLQYHDGWFDHELEAGRHVGLVKALVGDELVPASAAWFTKRPGSMTEIGPHRDAIGLPRGLKPGATIWIALDPADPDNGCLHYGCGSHRNDYPPGTPVGGFDVDAATAVPATVQPGDAVIHDSRTVHWSGGNPTDRPRRAVSFFYWGASNRTPEQVDEILARWRARK